jgi:hypothetical protein
MTFGLKCAGAEIGQDNSYQVNGGNWGKKCDLGSKLGM